MSEQTCFECNKRFSEAEPGWILPGGGAVHYGCQIRCLECRADYPKSWLGCPKCRAPRAEVSPEQLCLNQIIALQHAYQKAAQPWIDRLCAIEASKPPQPIFIPLHEAPDWLKAKISFDLGIPPDESDPLP